MEFMIAFFGIIYLAIRDLIDAWQEGKKWDDYARAYEAAGRKDKYKKE